MASVHIANYADMDFMFNISAGVGKNRPNKRMDVMLVQYLLRHAMNVEKTDYGSKGTPIAPPKYKGTFIGVDGVCGTETLDYIDHYQRFRNANKQRSGANKMDIDVRVATDGAVDPWKFPVQLNFYPGAGPLLATSTLATLCYDASNSIEFSRGNFSDMPPELSRILKAH